MPYVWFCMFLWTRTFLSWRLIKQNTYLDFFLAPCDICCFFLNAFFFQFVFPFSAEDGILLP